MHHLTSPLHLDYREIEQNDTSYRLSPTDTTAPEQELLTSIDRFGLLVPPLVRKAGEKYIILSGRKRILAAGALGMQILPVLVLSDEAGPADLYQCLLVHARTGSDLSVIELARVFSLAGNELQERELIGLLPYGGLKPRAYIVEELTALLDFEEQVVLALHEGKLQPATVNKMNTLRPDDRRAMIQLITHYRLGGSKQRKLVSCGIELYMRTGRSFLDIIEPWRMEKEKNAGNNLPQEAAALLAFLDKECHPQSTDAEERFHHLRQQLKLKPNMRLEHVPSFEDDRIFLTIEYENEQELLKQWQELQASLPGEENKP